jgi:predicted O-linked N-acetylglucosamine transferase (SPINDLY family)
MSPHAQALAVGLQSQQAGNLQRAERVYRQVLEIDPMCADALHLLGLLLYQVGETSPAIEALCRATEFAPNNALYHASLALVYRQTEKLHRAAASYQRFLTLAPDDAEGHYNLGVVLRRLGQLDDAAISFGHAVRLSPEFSAAYYNLGVVQSKLNQLPRAAASFRQAIKLKPDYVEAYYNLAVTLARQDEITEAVSQYQQVLQLHPEKTLWRLEMDTLFPAIPANAGEITRWRDRIQSALAGYPAGSINLNFLMKDIPTSSGLQVFNLHYHGQHNLPLMKQYASRFSVLPVQAPVRRKSSGLPRRVGFLVTAAHEGIFATMMAGLLNQLNPEKILPTVICPPQSVAPIRSRLSNPAIQFLPIPLDFEQAVETIRQAAFDLIYFWEVGTDAVNYFLPFFRLAPVQVTSWGSVGSTGIPAMDYFISSNLLEPPAAGSRYSEQLVRLDSPLTYFYRPELPARLKPRAEFDLPNLANLYFCPQTLRKFHPDFDLLLARILQRDPQGQLLLIEGRVSVWTDRLLARLRRSMPDVIDRIKFVPQQNYADYLNLMALSDVLLDTPYFGGGATTYDGLAVGTPLVTLPTDFMIGRVALGCYRQMGLPDCVADNPDDYVDTAVRLGTDPIHRARIKARILAANHVLYENYAAVREFERFCLQAVESFL